MDLSNKSLLDAAKSVLDESGKPLLASDIAEKMLTYGFTFTSNSQTPATCVGSSLLRLAKMSYKEFYRNDNHEFGLSKWESEDNLKAFCNALQDCRRGRKKGSTCTKSGNETGELIDVPSAVYEINVRSCPSYKTLRNELPKGFVVKVNAALNDFVENTKEYLVYNRHLTAAYLKTTVVLPFLDVLGYSIFNPAEVRPDCEVDGIVYDYVVFNSDGSIRFTVGCTTPSASVTNDRFKVSSKSPAIVIKGTQCNIFNCGVKISSFNLLSEDDILFYIVALHKDTFRVSLIGEQAFKNLVTSYLVLMLDNPTDAYLDFLHKELGLENSDKLKSVYAESVQAAIAQIVKRKK